MKLDITKKLVLIFTLGLLCLAGIGYRLEHDNGIPPAKPGTAIIDQAFPKALNKLRAGLKDLETAELGYAFSGEQQYKTAIGAAATLVLRLTRDIQAHSENAPARLQDFMRTEPLITQRVLFSKQIIETRETRGLKKAYAQIQTGFGKELTAQIEIGLAGLEADNASPLPDPDATQARNGHFSSLLVAAACGIVVVMVIAAIVLIGGALTRRETRTVRDLEEQLSIYSEGLKDHASIMLDPDGRCCFPN